MQTLQEQRFGAEAFVAKKDGN